MKNFKEWLSDNLRYLLLAFVVIAVIGAAIFGVNLYSKAVGGKNSSQTESQKETETKDTESKKETEKETEKDTETKKETEEKESGKESESETESQSETESGTESVSGSDQSESSESSGETTGQGASTESGSESGGNERNETAETIATEAPVPETQAAQTEPPQPTYLSINSACYLRSAPDYGDNIIGQYEAGTTVEFLGDVGGWYQVRVDGMTGYMGARFFN